MAERLPTQGDNTPPSLIPPPLGFAGLGDAYSQPMGPPSLSAFGQNLDQTPVLGGIKSLLTTPFSQIGQNLSGQVPLGTPLGQYPRGQFEPDPQAVAQEAFPMTIGGFESKLADPFIADLAKQAANRGIITAGKVADNPAVQRFVTEDAGLGRVNPFSGMSDEELIAKSKTAAPAEVKAVQDELGNRINAMGGNPAEAGLGHNPMGPMGVKTVDYSKLTRAIHETTPYKSVTGKGPGSFGAAVRQGVDTGNPTLEAQFTQGFLEKALLDAGYTPEAAQRALSQVDPGIVDQALVATGQDITPATRQAAAQNIGQMLASKAAQETAAASPEVVADAEQRIVGKLAKVVQDSAPETHPVQSISSLADLSEEVAVQAAEMPTLFGDATQQVLRAPLGEPGPFLRSFGPAARSAERAGLTDASTLNLKGAAGMFEPPVVGANQSLLGDTAGAPLFNAPPSELGPFLPSFGAARTAAERAGTTDAATLNLKGVSGMFDQPKVSGPTLFKPEFGGGGSGRPPGPPSGLGTEPVIPPSVGPSIAPRGPTLGARIAAAIKQIPNAFASSRNIASFDDSALTSQLSPFIGAHPQAWSKGAIQGLGGFYNRAGVFEDAMASLTRRVEQLGISVGDSGLFLSQEGGGIVRGESQTAGYKWLRDTVAKLWNVPVVGAGARVYEQGLARSERAMLWTLNATRVQSLESAVKLSEWAYRRPMTIPETQGIARSINIASGRGIDFSKMDPNGKVAALAQVGNGLFFSMQMQVARARLIPEVARAGARTAWNAAHLAAPLPGDIEMLRLGVCQTAFLAAQVAFLTGAGLKMVSDMNNTNFGKVDLGPTGYPGMDKAVALAELVGMRTQAYNGRVYLDLGQTMGGDMKLLTQMVGPFFGTNPTDANGKQWNPWKATGTQKTPWDLMGNWASNKLVPALSMITSRLQNRPIDMGDPTQNPATALIMPLVASSAIQASGASDPGGSLYMPQFSNLSPSDVEKNKLRDTIATVPGLTTLSGQRQQQFDDRVTRAVKSTLDAVVASPEYQAKTPEEKKANLDAVTQTVGRDTRRAFAIQVAKTGGPDEVVPALAIALAASTTNLAKGSTLASVVNAGRLTPDLASQVDALRNQPDRGKPNYDPSVQELLQGRDLTAKWLASPEFVVGNKADWDAAYLAATRLNALRAEDERKGIKPNEDTQLIDFYAQAANGALATYYTLGGSKRTQLVSPQRQEIQASPLWSMFETAANRAEHPKAP